MGSLRRKKEKSPMTQKADEKQIKAFRKAARELGCDDNEDRFQETLRTVAKAKPQPHSVKKEKRG
jgi:hypothetical protein